MQPAIALRHKKGEDLFKTDSPRLNRECSRPQSPRLKETKMKIAVDQLFILSVTFTMDTPPLQAPQKGVRASTLGWEGSWTETEQEGPA